MDNIAKGDVFGFLWEVAFKLVSLGSAMTEFLLKRVDLGVIHKSLANLSMWQFLGGAGLGLVLTAVIIKSIVALL